MSVKSKFKHSLHRVLYSSKTGSYATRYDRERIILQATDQLFELGYKIPSVQGLKQKHIVALVDHWKEQSLASATIKNRLSGLRRLAEMMNRPQIVPSNQVLAVQPRKYVSNTNRALYQPDFSRVYNPYIKISVELQRVFGLRREESLKIKPHLADRGKELELYPSWCKGGRTRRIPIRTDEQRYWLNQAKQMATTADHSLIPEQTTYIRHRDVYVKQLQRAGLSRLHGLRHAYAQERYKELTGWEAPINGGPNAKQLTPEQKNKDLHARLILSEELGHSRESITVSYLGR